MSLWDRDPQELLRRLEKVVWVLESEGRDPNKWEEKNLVGALEAFARNELPLVQAHLDALPLPLAYLFNDIAEVQTPRTRAQLRELLDKVRLAHLTAKV